MAGETVLIESFGMVEITVRQDGAELQVAPGMALNLAIPPPAGMDAPPERAPLWSLNEETNLWVMEGEAVLDADTGVYRAEIAHMSSWNVDNPLEATCITGLVETPDGDPLPGARITASGVDYFGTSTATSIEDGRFYVAVRMDSTVTVTASHQQGGGQQRTVESGSTPTGVPPRPEVDECLDVGKWTVERGRVTVVDDSGNVNEIDCRNLGPNPFAGTCAAGFFDVYSCWAPAGRCDIRGDVANPNSNSFEIVYTNGSRAEVRINRESGAFAADYYGPAGQLCATGEQLNEDGQDIFWMTINGQRYGIPDSEDDNDIVIICPNGETARFTQAEVDALSACGVGGGGDDNQQCTINGMEQAPPPDPDNPPGAPMQGERNSMCGNAGPCNSGLQCCMLEGFPDGVGVCIEPMICQAAMSQGG